MRKEWVKKAEVYYSKIVESGYTCIGNTFISDLGGNLKYLDSLKEGEKITSYNIYTGEKESFIVKGKLDILSSINNNSKFNLTAFESKGKILKEHEVLFVKNI